MHLQERINEACDYLKGALGDRQPRIGIILGSGLGALAEEVEDACYIPYKDVPHMHESTTTSHVGRFVAGKLNGIDVIVMQGRLHGYEGNTAEDVALPVWAMAQLGVETLITTNSAGAINPSFHVGDFCLMSDHIHFTGRNPIANADANDIAFRFFSMENAYDPKLRAIAEQVATQYSIPLREGVYLGLLGPSFETPAEIKAFRIWGADTVAMSVVEEVIAARHVGVRVLGMSIISNMACGIAGFDISDDEILAVAAERRPEFSQLIKGIIAEL